MTNPHHLDLDSMGPTCDVETAAAACGISRGLAYKLAATGQLPGVLKLGGRYRVVTAVLRQSLQPGEPTSPAQRSLGNFAGGRTVVTIPEVAEYLGVGTRQVYRMAARGQLPGLVHLGRRLLVSVPALAASLLGPAEA